MKDKYGDVENLDEDGDDSSDQTDEDDDAQVITISNLLGIILFKFCIFLF